LESQAMPPWNHPGHPAAVCVTEQPIQKRKKGIFVVAGAALSALRRILLAQLFRRGT
jgi:hypothetical protein